MKIGKTYTANTKGRPDEVHTHGKKYKVLREGGLAPALDGTLKRSFVCEDAETGAEYGWVEGDAALTEEKGK